jgi:hypothetical protein
MNPNTGDIRRYEDANDVPSGWLVLTNDEAKELLAIPDKDLRIERYLKLHRADVCRLCDQALAVHTVEAFKECAATELGSFDTGRLDHQVRIGIGATASG